MHLELRQTSMMEFFCKKFQYIIDICLGLNAFEVVDVSYYKELRLSLTGIFECHDFFRKFMVKLIAIFDKREDRQPTTCQLQASLRWSKVQKRMILQRTEAVTRCLL